MGEKGINILTVVRQKASSALHQQAKGNIVAAQATLGLTVLVIAALLSACNVATPAATSQPQPPAATNTSSPTNIPSPTDTPSPTSPPSPTVASSPTTAPAGTSMPQPTANPTSLDPCQLLPGQEASALAGVTFNPGVEGSTDGGGKTCTYGSQTINVFFVEVAQAPDKATAEMYKAQFLDDLKARMPELAAAGLQVNQLPNFADGAVTGLMSLNAGGASVSGSAFGFLKGTTFFGFSDVAIGTAAPSLDAMQSEATTVLSRLP